MCSNFEWKIDFVALFTSFASFSSFSFICFSSQFAGSRPPRCFPFVLFSFNKSRPRCFDVAASHVGYVLLPGIANDGIAFGVVLAGCCNFFIHQEALVRVVPKIGQFLLFGPSIYMNGPRNVMKTDEANKVAADEWNEMKWNTYAYYYA